MRMKLWPIITAFIVGAIMGIMSVGFLTLAFGFGSIPRLVTVILFITCPASFILLTGLWWLVPMVNGILYLALVFGFAKWRMRRARQGLSKA